MIVPEIVPTNIQKRPQNRAWRMLESAFRMQRFFFTTTIPATDWRAAVYSDEPASAFLVVGLGKRWNRARTSAVGRRRSPEPLRIRRSRLPSSGPTRMPAAILTPNRRRICGIQSVRTYGGAGSVIVADFTSGDDLSRRSIY